MPIDGLPQGVFISVIIASLNAQGTIARAIDSVLDQTHADKELIVMDGGSSDGTVEVIRSRTDRLAHWESESDRGIAHAWNKGVEHARGRWICFLGSDDMLHDRDVLSRMAPRLSEFEEQGVLLVYGDVNIMDSTCREVLLSGNPQPDWVARHAHQGGFIHHSGAFHARELFHGRRFDESYRICSDQHMLWPVFIAGLSRHVPVLVADCPLGGLGGSFATHLDAKRETLRVIRSLGLASFPVRFLVKLASIAAFVTLTRPLGSRRAAKLADWTRKLRGLPPRFSV